jgi:hypothetical protein
VQLAGLAVCSFRHEDHDPKCGLVMNWLGNTAAVLFDSSTALFRESRVRFRLDGERGGKARESADPVTSLRGLVSLFWMPVAGV